MPQRNGLAEVKIVFWTSTEYSGFMAGLIRELQDLGHSAEQRYQIPEATYRASKSTSERFLLRIRQYLIYPIQLSAVLFLQRLAGFFYKGSGLEGEICIVSTNTFYAPLIATYLHPRTVHLVYDLFPEAMIHAGKWREGSPKVKLVRWVVGKTIQRANLNVYLGERLKQYTESIHGSSGNSTIIAVGADQSLFHNPPQPDKKIEESSKLHAITPSHNRPTVLYCGNLGNMHETETLFAYWRSLENSREYKEESEKYSPLNLHHSLLFKFHCSGPKRAALEEVYTQLPQSVQETITIGNGLDQEAWIEAMTSAQVALVTMALGSETVVMPSKIYSAMMAGQAILAIAPEKSDLVDLIKTADCGWWVQPGDASAVDHTIKAIASDLPGSEQKRANAYAYAHAQLGQDTLTRQWEAQLKNAFFYP